MSEPSKQRVYLSLGSNINRDHHLRAALDALSQAFGQLMISRVYESESVGFSGDNFYNLAVGLDSNLPVSSLATMMHTIEDNNGRQRNGVRFGPRTLDIDILTYGNCQGTIDDIALPRDEILENAFVLFPLADIAGDDKHPVCGRPYRELAEQFNKPQQKLWPVDFIWAGRQISSTDN